MKVLVVGTGRIGAPLLTWLAHKNLTHKKFSHLAGVDVDQSIVGKPVSARFKENGWEKMLDELDKNSSVPLILTYPQAFELQGGYQDVVIITCGTPVDNNQNPDTRQIKAAITSLRYHGLIDEDTLIILRSTIFPGGTKWIRRYIKEEFKFNPKIVMAPERIAEGYTFDEIDTIPQIIGGESYEEIDEAIKFFYNFFGSTSCHIIEPYQGGSTGAELAKLFCNSFRYIQFATANEFHMLCEDFGANFNAVRNACNKGYFRGGVPMSALNVGGPCLGKDAKILAAYSKNSEIVESAYRVAEKTPMYWLEKINVKGLYVGVLGLAFKKNSDNPMNSLSFKLIKHLEILGAKYVFSYDPHITHKSSLKTAQDVIDSCEVIFVMTEHDSFKNLVFPEGKVVVRM